MWPAGAQGLHGMRLILPLLVATAILSSWTADAAAAVWPEHNYSVRIGHRRFGVIDWSDDRTTIFMGSWNVESPLRPTTRTLSKFQQRSWRALR